MKFVKLNRKRKLKPLTIGLTTMAALLFLAFIIALIQLIYKKLRQKQKSPLPPLVEEHYRRVSYNALANGTAGFSEENLLGKGSFGAVYKCTFHDEGIIAAVKVFNPEQSGSTRSFVAECEALRRMRHRCLLPVIARAGTRGLEVIHEYLWQVSPRMYLVRTELLEPSLRRVDEIQWQVSNDGDVIIRAAHLTG